MRLKIEVIIANDGLDGPALLRSLPVVFESVAVNVASANVTEGHMILAPAGLSEPVEVDFRAGWVGRPAERLIPENVMAEDEEEGHA